MKQKNTKSATESPVKIPEELQKIKPAIDSIDTKADILISQPHLTLPKVEFWLDNEEVADASKLAEISSKKYAYLFDFAPIGYLLLSREGRINEINHIGASILGKKRHYLKNTLFGNFVSEESKAIFILFLSKIFGGEAQQTCEIMLTTEGLVPVYASLNGIISKAREECMVTVTYITACMFMIDHREESENNFCQSFEEDLTGNFIINEKGTLLNCNPSFLKIFGYDRKEEIIGENITLLHNDPSEFEFIKSELKAHKMLLNYETNRKRRNGDLIYIVENKVASFNAAGEIIEIKGFLYDITNCKKAETEQKLKNEKLEKLIAEKDRFSSLIAHDLRGPFNGFIGLSKILADEISTLEPDEIQKMGNVMWKSASNLYILLENLLQWSQMEQGLMPYKPELINLHSFIEKALTAEVETAQKKGIDSNFDIPGNIFVLADAKMLRSILCNLYTNATKFTTKWGKIKISAKHSANNQIEISIHDNGIGMCKDMQLGLFHLNIQINRKGTDGELSTGLGLFLCKDFIEKHGGTIWAESDEGKGSTFHFTLPCIAKDDSSGPV